MENIIIQQINKLPLSSITISNLFFFHLKPHQVISWYSYIGKNLVGCNNVYIWRTYFQKWFTDEYNDYLQCLLNISKETPDFYYNHLQYIVQRDTFSILSNIHGIKREEKKRKFKIERFGEGFKVVGGDKYITNYINMEAEDMFSELYYLLDHIMRITDFPSFYQIVSYKSDDPQQQDKIKDVILYHIMMRYKNGSERYLPIEFIQLAHLKMDIPLMDLLKTLPMIYGSTFYLNSIELLTIDKQYFRKKVGNFIHGDPVGIYVIRSFHNFSRNSITEYIFKYAIHNGKNNGILHNYTKKRVNVMAAVKMFLFFFDSNLKYLRYDQPTIQKINNRILQHFENTNFVVKNCLPGFN